MDDGGKMPIDAEASLKGRLVAVINTGSGADDTEAPADMQKILAAAGHAHAEVTAVAPHDIEAALTKAASEAEVVVVLGGDGTIRTAAACAGGQDKLLIPLPGGTMNMLPKALYGERPWRQALTDTLAAPRIRDVSGGRAGTENFYCAAILGAPSLWADAREALRGGDPIEAVKRGVTAIRRSASDRLSYTFADAPPETAEAVAVICPLISRAMADDERCLEVAALAPVVASAIFRMAFHAAFDDWRNDPSVSLAKVRHLEVRGHGRTPLIVDGERVQMGRVVRVDFVPVAFRALVPAEPPA